MDPGMSLNRPQINNKPIGNNIMDNNATEKLEEYNTAIVDEAKRGHTHVCQLLLDAGADVNARNDAGETLLNVAADWEWPEICRLLLDRGADTNIKDCCARVPLHNAAKRKNLSICTMLLEHGADANACDYCKWTPLHDALSYNSDGDIDICRILLDAGADVNAVTSAGFTPLHIAAREGNVNDCKLLVSRGADLAIEDNHGRKPLDYMPDISWLGEIGTKTPPSHNPDVYVVTKERHMFQWDDVGHEAWGWVRWDDDYDGTYIECVFKHEPTEDELETIAFNDARDIGEWMRDFFGGDGTIKTQMIDTPPGTRSKGIAYATAESVYDNRAKVEVTVCASRHALRD